MKKATTEEDVETERRNAMVQKIKDIMSASMDGSVASIRAAAKEEGLCVVTQKQFKIMEWGTRQLKIRRLQHECDELLREMNSL
jgi:hypothetical protein